MCDVEGHHQGQSPATKKELSKDIGGAMIHIIKLDLDALPLGELPVTDLRHVKNEIYKHRRTLALMNDYRKVVAQYNRNYREKRKAV